MIEIFRNDMFDPEDLHNKWRAIVRNLTELNGKPVTTSTAFIPIKRNIAQAG